MSLPLTETAETIASIPDSSKVTFSPTVNDFLFEYTNSTTLSFVLSTYVALAPLDAPLIVSPTITSMVVAFGPVKVERESCGELGSERSNDSKIPYMLMTSGTFKQISSS